MGDMKLNATRATLELAKDAIELNERAPITELTDDGFKFRALDGFEPELKHDGSIDRDATAKAQLKLAGDYLLKAGTPDKALIFGTVGAATSGVGSSVVGAALGLVADVLEAVPSALLGVGYLVSAAVNKVR